MRIALLMAASLSLFGKLFGADDEPPFEVAEIYRDMRSQVLNLNPESMSGFEDAPVLALLMETGMAGAGFTLVSAADGSASIYFTNGGGIIGAGEHKNVRSESLKMIKMASDFLQHMTKIEEFPIVSPGTTTFYIVTSDGVFTYSAKEEDLGEERDKKLSPLFHQGHSLIYQIQVAEQNRPEQGNNVD